MQCSQRTFRPDNKEDQHSCTYFTFDFNVTIVLSLLSYIHNSTATVKIAVPLNVRA